jgi:lipoyl synthase
MPELTAETIWNLNQKQIITLLNSGIFIQKPKNIRFYSPSFIYYKTKHYCSSSTDFPTISITGTSCSLNCKHCGGKILQTMHPVLSPKEFFGVCAQLKRDGAKGCLISGGCLPDGSVPLDSFMPTIGKVKQELGLTVFVHTGIINSKIAVALKTAGIDAALIDIVGSDRTIQKTLNLSVKPKDYLESLQALDEAGLNFVPHVIVGLNEGKLDGELDALKMISQVKPSAIVVIAFMPIRGTAMAKTPPPISTDIAKVIALARFMFPETPLVLGCMRPKIPPLGATDILALKAGVDGIAFPSEEGIKYAEKKGFGVSFSSYCCAQIYMDAVEKTEH